MTGGLFDPLGQDRAEPAPRRPATLVLAGLALAALAALVAVSFVRDDGDRGRPMAISPIVRVDAPRKPAPPASPDRGAAPDLPGLPPVAADQEVEIQNGVRIVRPRRSASGPTGQTLTAPVTGPPPR